MSNILKNFTTKKGSKEWAKLTDEQRQEIINTAVSERIASVLCKEIANYVSTGMDVAYEHLYKKFVEDNIDLHTEETPEWFDGIEQLLSFLREKHLEQVKKNGGKK